MSKVIKFCKKYLWVVIVFLALLFIPQSFSYQAKINERVLVTGLAVDKDEKGYEITAQIVRPATSGQTDGGQAGLDFISEKGESVFVALQKIAYKTGKIAGLSHTKFIIMGDTMSDENIVSALDYFARDSQITPSLLLLFCQGHAKEMIMQTKQLELSVGVGLQKVFLNKQSSLNGTAMTISDFINGAYGISKSSVASGILIAKEGEEVLGESTDATAAQKGYGGFKSGASSSNEGGSGEESSENEEQGLSGQNQDSKGSQESAARIKYYNDIYYFKNGEYINKLNTEDEILGYLFADNFISNGQFYVSEVSGAGLNNAVISGQLTHKRTKHKINFKEDKPVLTIEVSIKNIIIEEILNQSNINVDLYNFKNKEILTITKQAVKEKIEKCIKAAFDKAKKDNVDIFDVAERAYQKKPHQWKKFYEEYGENYLDQCKIEIKVNIKDVN